MSDDTPKLSDFLMDESVTLDPQQFTRWAEIVEYAEGYGGDIQAAIISLVNSGLSHRR